MRNGKLGLFQMNELNDGKENFFYSIILIYKGMKKYVQVIFWVYVIVGEKKKFC